MKIRIRDIITTSRKEIISIQLTPSEKKSISKMPANEDVFTCFPEGTPKEARIEFNEHFHKQEETVDTIKP